MDNCRCQASQEDGAQEVSAEHSEPAQANGRRCTAAGFPNGRLVSGQRAGMMTAYRMLEKIHYCIRQANDCFGFRYLRPDERWSAAKKWMDEAHKLTEGGWDANSSSSGVCVGDFNG